MLTLHLNALIEYKKTGYLWNDQQTLGILISGMRDRKTLAVKVLDIELFPNGEQYFWNGKRMFATDNPTNKPVLIHNNFLREFSNKRYRLKELLLWMVDDNHYYSNKDAKYITYENHLDLGYNKTLLEERRALVTAFMFAKLMNRTVILPEFHCYGCVPPACKTKEQDPKFRCSAYVHFSMKVMDRFLNGFYREHMFLRHPLVPNAIKNSCSPKLLVKSEFVDRFPGNFDNTGSIFMPSTLETKAGLQEILTWLEKFKQYSVVRFHSLYGLLYYFEGIEEQYEQTVQQGLKRN